PVLQVLLGKRIEKRLKDGLWVIWVEFFVLIVAVNAVHPVRSPGCPPVHESKQRVYCVICVGEDGRLLEITTGGLAEDIRERVLEDAPLDDPQESTVRKPGQSPEFNRPEHLGTEDRGYGRFGTNGVLNRAAQTIRWRIGCNRLADHPADEADTLDIGKLA